MAIDPEYMKLLDRFCQELEKEKENEIKLQRRDEDDLQLIPSYVDGINFTRSYITRLRETNWPIAGENLFRNLDHYVGDSLPHSDHVSWLWFKEIKDLHDRLVTEELKGGGGGKSGLAIFNAAVKVHFGKLAKEHGLKLRKVDEAVYELESKFVAIEVSWARDHLPYVVTFVGPGKRAAKKYGTEGYGIELLLEVLDVKPRPGPEENRSPEEMETSVRRQAEALGRHCGGILSGELSLWPRLKRLSNKKFRESLPEAAGRGRVKKKGKE